MIAAILRCGRGAGSRAVGAGEAVEQSFAMKIVIALAFVVILAALASAGLFMLRRDSGAEGSGAAPKGRMARALAVRVGVSIAIFLFVLIGHQLGWIAPTGLPVGR